MTGFIANCSGSSGQTSGFGRIHASLSGNASLKAEDFSGTLTINWPAGGVSTATVAHPAALSRA